ncbi:MAG: hypothetical protein CL764_04925 [Chloroflexi bacterium]|nr:hypothetical protein [Chloroflexota bacterium]|tara:strand:+ start:1063 stop:1989 length:927 start_codon:yes stop_codon:yes gene_type:complete
MHFLSSTYKNINSFNHSGSSDQTMETFWDFINKWNFLNITNVSGIISLTLLILIIGTYLIGLIRLVKKSNLKKMRIVSITTALFLVLFVLEGPIDYFAEQMFFIHMIQHLTIMVIIAPVLLFSNPMPMFIWGTPNFLRKIISKPFSGNSLLKRTITKITKPKYSLSIYIIVLYFWHIPFFYNAALQNNGVHYINHLLFFFASIIYWWPIIGPSPVKSPLSVIKKIIYVLIAVTPSAALAAFITFSPTPLYDYSSTPLHWNVASHVEDQRWGGIIMWLPGNFLFLGFLIGLFFLWAKEEEKDALPKLKK